MLDISHCIGTFWNHTISIHMISDLDALILNQMRNGFLEECRRDHFHAWRACTSTIWLCTRYLRIFSRLKYWWIEIWENFRRNWDTLSMAFAIAIESTSCPDYHRLCSGLSSSWSGFLRCKSRVFIIRLGYSGWCTWRAIKRWLSRWCWWCRYR